MAGPARPGDLGSRGDQDAVRWRAVRHREDILRAAGLTRGLVHHYFSGRKDVYIALLERRNGNFPMTDSDGNTVTAKERLIARTTIKDGRVTYERPAE